jgi:hypothetical protein
MKVVTIMCNDFTGKRVNGCEECEAQTSGACVECLVDQINEKGEN